MERSKRIRATAMVVLIILFHVVGIIGFCTAKYHDLFLYLVPYHLILMTLAIFYAYGRASVRLTVFFIITYVLGYACEWIGVHKNWLFGDYDYGPTLGTKLLDIPLLMGVNWFMLIFSAGALMQKVQIRNQLVRIIAGAALLVALDVILEPIAMKYNYWDWTNDIIPFKNYACWFLLSVIMLWIFERFRFKRLSWAAPVLLIMQFVFFGMLNFV